MSLSPSPDDKGTFETALASLLQRAHANGIDVEGAWKCAINDETAACWDVQVVRVVDEEDED